MTPSFPQFQVLFGKIASTSTLEPGQHSVAIRLRGQELFSSKAMVKPLAQGNTVLAVPKLVDPDAPGTLQIDVHCTDPNWWMNLEMFIDDGN